MLLAEQGVASQTLKLSLGSQDPTFGGYRLEEFLKELPTVIKRAEPSLGSLLAGNVPLGKAPQASGTTDKLCVYYSVG